MAHPILKAASGIFPQTEIDRLKHPGAGDLNSEKQRLRKATKEFESLFMYEMLKTMRKTIPKDSSSENAIFSSGFGKDTFMQMFDMELARKMANGGQGSISEILYNSLVSVIGQQDKPEPSPVTIEPLNQTKNRPTKINREHESVPLPRSRPIKIHHQRGRLIPIHSSQIKSSKDPILLRFGQFIDEAAQRASLDSSLIYAVIKAESNGDPHAVSPAGAKGLMQLADSTARDYRVDRVFDPRENIIAGSKYLRHLLDRFGDLRLALAAYNAGPRNVERHNGIPPFEETRTYIDKVTNIIASRHRTIKLPEAKVRTEDVR